MKRDIERSHAATRLVLGSLVALILTAGCISNFANGNTMVSPTVGKQLTDLEQARKDNLVTEEEYEELRERIIKQGPVSQGGVPREPGKDEPKESD